MLTAQRSKQLGNIVSPVNVYFLISYFFVLVTPTACTDDGTLPVRQKQQHECHYELYTDVQTTACGPHLTRDTMQS